MVDIGEVVLLSFVAGLGVAVLTAPVGVSGAVFLLPIQLTVLHVPSPAVTPTNLLFNIVAIPGALARYRAQAPLNSPLTTVLLIGTLPGVVIGAVIRVFLIPGSQIFRILVAAFLLPLGIWLCVPSKRRAGPPPAVPPRRYSMVALAAGVGVIGGIYGIGGGSLLSPILVGRGLPIAIVAPATLVSTFVTSAAGAITYVVLALATAGHHITPNWTIGLVAGAGGLIGGYLGARLQPCLPERVLQVGLGVSAIATATLYAIQALE
ncbi:anion permease (plasmid) [Mycobacterium sp. 20KCMC460]|uniref:Probable membrane transporter protein n=1 Tax=Mycobacterium kiyosense TaxID=2871094 RepID=A0AA37VDB1_9MYCO|nr:anion permease [Mycobacterium sp. 20KCMC460]GLB87080.1 anion permease [Mycobacterium kiyosense]GLB99376.1 anion permease [Mycobacterium kiyosense]GLC05307.1 anion permease [Mycobacterium kiyosense]GLC11360.1 anion permease [Mycobacterium kiyosense]